MRNARDARNRPAAVAVETAIVLPVFLFLLVFLIVGGMGVFQYQQVTCLAQEAARWASVRGADFQKDTNQQSPTQDQIFAQAVLSREVSMDPTQLSLAVQWIDKSSNTAQDWDGASKYVKSVTATGEYVTNTVRATITYTWSPGLFLPPIAIQSVCEAPMSN